MLNLKPVFRATIGMLTLVSMTGLASSCGGKAYRDASTSAAGTTITTTGGTTPTTGTTTTGTTTDTTPITASAAFSFSLTGNGGTSPISRNGPIKTDNMLKVQVTAEDMGQLAVPGVSSNLTAGYSCVTYTVTLYTMLNNVLSRLSDNVQTTKLSPSGGGKFCASAPKSQVLDFSPRITAGHGDLYVQISNPEYDFYCQQWDSCQTIINYGPVYGPMVAGMWYQSCVNFYPYSSQSLYCGGTDSTGKTRGLRAVYKNHTIKGDLDVQTNGTTL